jgi:hypothetical protein
MHCCACHAAEAALFVLLAWHRTACRCGGFTLQHSAGVQVQLAHALLCLPCLLTRTFCTSSLAPAGVEVPLSNILLGLKFSWPMHCFACHASKVNSWLCTTCMLPCRCGRTCTALPRAPKPTPCNLVVLLALCLQGLRSPSPTSC